MEMAQAVMDLRKVSRSPLARAIVDGVIAIAVFAGAVNVCAKPLLASARTANPAIK